MMQRLVEILDEEGYSCVVANGDDVRTFSQRGVADLHHLSKVEPEFLRGALIADKVVGKGAAAIMVQCGVRRLYSHTISEGAMELLNASNIEVEYGQIVPHIINRSGDGWCPVERLCREVSRVEDIIPMIDKFIEENKKK